MATAPPPPPGPPPPSDAPPGAPSTPATGVGAMPAFPSPTEAEPLLNALEDTVKQLTKLRSMVDGFYEGAQQPFNEGINGLLSNLEQIDKVRDSLNVMVPVDVLDTIDHREDNNPKLYTKTRIDATLAMLNENTHIGQACVDAATIMRRRAGDTGTSTNDINNSDNKADVEMSDATTTAATDAQAL